MWKRSRYRHIFKIAFLQRMSTTSKPYDIFFSRLQAVTLFSWSVEQNARRKWPRAWLKARGGRGTKKERLPAKPERMVFHGLVSFWHENWSVDRPGTNVTRDLRVCLNKRGFPTFLFLKSSAYAVYIVRVDSKQIDWANLNFGRWSHI